MSNCSNSEFCNSESCKQEALWILGKIDTSVDPWVFVSTFCQHVYFIKVDFSCNDFYHFSCGNYIKNQEISNDTHKLDEMDKMRDKLEQELNETFYSEIIESELEALKLSKKLFRSCMDIGRVHLIKLPIWFSISFLIEFRINYESRLAAFKSNDWRNGRLAGNQRRFVELSFKTMAKSHRNCNQKWFFDRLPVYPCIGTKFFEKLVRNDFGSIFLLKWTFWNFFDIENLLRFLQQNFRFQGKLTLTCKETILLKNTKVIRSTQH